MIDPNTDRVLITGAAGAIGTALRDGLRANWRHLRLTDVRPMQNLTNNEQAIVSDISDRSAIEAMMQDVRAVVHLAGVIGEYDLETLFRVNARGLFDVFESARLAGVERIVFASSNHAFGCYPITEPVSPALPPRPDSLYGVFKVWGETM
jgi:uronate dehydrogenase